MCLSRRLINCLNDPPSSASRGKKKKTHTARGLFFIVQFDGVFLSAKVKKTDLSKWKYNTAIGRVWFLPLHATGSVGWALQVLFCEAYCFSFWSAANRAVFVLRCSSTATGFSFFDQRATLKNRINRATTCVVLMLLRASPG